MRPSPPIVPPYSSALTPGRRRMSGEFFHTTSGTRTFRRRLVEDGCSLQENVADHVFELFAVCTDLQD